jgi:hypothetical protein
MDQETQQEALKRKPDHQQQIESRRFVRRREEPPAITQKVSGGVCQPVSKRIPCDGQVEDHGGTKQSPQHDF